jgi:hypothetical protein
MSTVCNRPSCCAAERYWHQRVCKALEKVSFIAGPIGIKSSSSLPTRSLDWWFDGLAELLKYISRAVKFILGHHAGIQYQWNSSSAQLQPALSALGWEHLSYPTLDSPEIWCMRMTSLATCEWKCSKWAHMTPTRDRESLVYPRTYRDKGEREWYPFRAICHIPHIFWTWLWPGLFLIWLAFMTHSSGFSVIAQIEQYWRIFNVCSGISSLSIASPFITPCI